MNTPVPPSGSARESFSQAAPSLQTAAPVFSQARLLYWSLRRELWEFRSIYIAPLAVGAVFLFGFLISLAHLPHKMRSLSTLDPARQAEAIAMPYDVAAGLMMLTTILVSFFYCLDALHGERRDRSILFWKSLPVSDLTTVLSKAAIPVVVLPLFTFAVAVVLHWAMLLLSTLALLAGGQSVATLWTHLPLIRMAGQLLYHLLTAHALWPAPIYCWLLLVSAWARRAPLLWASLPLLAIGAVERIVFQTSSFLTMLGQRLIGGGAGSSSPSDRFPMGPMTHLTPLAFLLSPGLWIGFLLAALFLACAVRVRRDREPI